MSRNLYMPIFVPFSLPLRDRNIGITFSLLPASENLSLKHFHLFEPSRHSCTLCPSFLTLCKANNDRQSNPRCDHGRYLIKRLLGHTLIELVGAFASR